MILQYDMRTDDRTMSRTPARSVGDGDVSCRTLCYTLSTLQPLLETVQNAEVAKFGQRREIQGLVSKEFRGSNPRLRIQPIWALERESLRFHGRYGFYLVCSRCTCSVSDSLSDVAMENVPAENKMVPINIRTIAATPFFDHRSTVSQWVENAS
jgi:hypothetical protein